MYMYVPSAKTSTGNCKKKTNCQNVVNLYKFHALIETNNTAKCEYLTARANSRPPLDPN